jgi:Holliday junction resolvasome RuvABC ATP-dependent DNA helicase subunit
MLGEPPVSDTTDRDYLRAVLTKWRESGESESALVAAYGTAQETITAQAETILAQQETIERLQAALQKPEPTEADNE